MTGRLIAIALLGVAGASCGAESAEGTKASSRAGEGGTQLQEVGGRSEAKGGSTSTAGSGTAAGGSSAGKSGAGGAAGHPEPGVGGTAGASNLAGSTGGADDTEPDTGGLPEGKSQLALEVISADGVTHVTTCTEHPREAAMYEFSDGERQGYIECYPDQGGVGDLFVNNLGLSFYASSLGRTEGNDLTFTCDPAVDHCEGVTVFADFQVGGKDSNGFAYLSSSQVSARSGWFQLDAFTAEGKVSGSLDVTLSTEPYSVTLRGDFAAHLLDCGLPGMTPNVYGCATTHN